MAILLSLAAECNMPFCQGGETFVHCGGLTEKIVDLDSTDKIFNNLEIAQVKDGVAQFSWFMPVQDICNESTHAETQALFRFLGNQPLPAGGSVYGQVQYPSGAIPKTEMKDFSTTRLVDLQGGEIGIGVGQWATPVTLNLYVTIQFPFSGNVSEARTQLAALEVLEVKMTLKYRRAAS